MTRLFPKRPRTGETKAAARPAPDRTPATTSSAEVLATRRTEPRRRRRPRRLVALVLVLAAGLATALSLSTMPGRRVTLPARDGTPLTAVTRWGYQLQGVKAELIPEAVDLLVVDYSRDGTDRGRFSPGSVERLRTRKDGRKRIVLAYLSIGEAERYRYYWQGIWRFSPPRWLGPENREWRGNFTVRYWDPEWQRLLLEPEPSRLAVLLEHWLKWNTPYVDRILEAGFDGLYLDRVDSFAEWPSHPSAQTDMAALIGRLSRYAKARRPGTLIVQQNGEELLRRRDVLAAIDGVAKEDLVFGGSSEGEPNGASQVSDSIADLMRARREGKPVLVVEYVESEAKRSVAKARLAPTGFPLLFATRALNEPPSADDGVRAAPRPAPGPVTGPAAGKKGSR